MSFLEFASLKPFTSIGHIDTSKVKVKVRDICLNISFVTSFFSFFTHTVHEKKFKVFSKKKKSLDISLQHKTPTYLYIF